MNDKKLIRIGYILFGIIVISYFTIPMLFKKKDYNELEKVIYKIEKVYEEKVIFGDDRFTIYKFNAVKEMLPKDSSLFINFKDDTNSIEQFKSFEQSSAYSDKNKVRKEKIFKEINDIIKGQNIKSYSVINGEKGIYKLYIYNEDLNIGYLIFEKI